MFESISKIEIAAPRKTQPIRKTLSDKLKETERLDSCFVLEVVCWSSSEHQFSYHQPVVVTAKQPL